VVAAERSESSGRRAAQFPERSTNVKSAASKPPATRPALKNALAAKAKNKPPEQTFQEVKYLRYLVEQEIPICVKLVDNEEVSGIVEFYDKGFIRITREGAPNLFIFKHDIKYLYELET
jgi:host factor-I protein